MKFKLNEDIKIGSTLIKKGTFLNIYSGLNITTGLTEGVDYLLEKRTSWADMYRPLTEKAFNAFSKNFRGVFKNKNFNDFVIKDRNNLFFIISTEGEGSPDLDNVVIYPEGGSFILFDSYGNKVAQGSVDYEDAIPFLQDVYSFSRQQLSTDTLYITTEDIEKDEIKALLLSFNIDPEKAEILDDLSINYNGSINLGGKNLLEIPFMFNTVKGNFDISDNPLVSLRGCPDKVTGNFECSVCFQLTSLIEGPSFVAGDYNCFGCKRLNDLKGMPNKVRTFTFEDCRGLESLIGGPSIVNGDYMAGVLPRLKNLSGLPKVVTGNLAIKTSFAIDITDITDVCDVSGYIHYF